MKVNKNMWIDFDALMNCVTEMWDSRRDWELKKNWSAYSAKHCVSFEDWKRISREAYTSMRSYEDTLWSVAQVCKFDFARLEKAMRFAWKWYERNRWEKCLSSETEEMLLRYIINGDKRALLDWRDAHSNTLWKQGVRGKDLWNF